jgi:hypothetical protein
LTDGDERGKIKWTEENGMNKKPDSMMYIMGLAGLIVVAVITTSIISAVKNSGNATDTRAKAGVVNTLKLVGTIESVDALTRELTVLDVQFAAESRSGKAVNYGTWKVMPPAAFDSTNAVPGVKINFTVNSDSFDVSAKQVIAAQMSITK